MFGDFKVAVTKQFDSMKSHPLFRVQVDRDKLWDTYLKSFPEGTNPIYKERTEYDCQCCKSFIRNAGNVVAIIDGKVVSIWDFKIDNFFQGIADALSALVKSSPIEDIFLHTESEAGTDTNRQMLDGGKIITWRHLHIKIPQANKVAGADIGTKLGMARSSKEVFLRALSEITQDAVDTVLELIAQNSLYRGQEHKFVVESFDKLKKQFDKLKTDEEKDTFSWTNFGKSPAIAGIRNTVIGTLLVDLSEGKDLEAAVKAFEVKVAPTNYKRPTALVTKAMVDKAKQTVEELGFTSALERRFATIQDITVNNILFADRNAKKAMTGNVFDDIAGKVAVSTKSLDKVEEVGIETFIKDILPKATAIEVMVENRHANNLVSLVAPVDSTAKCMFKWPNNFSWSYTGELTDSIKERVKNAGGNVTGDLRCSLSWFNYDDLDLHMYEPDGYHIYFSNKGRNSPSYGKLDVDMNMGSGTTRSPVENIIYPDKGRMKEGVYSLRVNNWSKRESVDVGFDIEIEFNGITHTISYDKAVCNGETIEVAQIRYSRKTGFEIIKSLPTAQTVKQLWGISTQSFHKASVIMLSPNHWDEKAVGNKHYFFMLDGCVNDGKARGFFNEFLSEELNAHRKVLEVVGSKMKTEESANQLSGLGFSSTQRNSIFCRVSGSFARIVKVIF